MSKYVPTFAEETFIANCYGTQEEIDWFNRLMESPMDRGNMVEIIILIEAIKNRNHLGMDWNCCWRCQRYSHCEINWYRGERGLKKTCCPNCENYRACTRIFISQRVGTCCALNKREKGTETVRLDTPELPDDPEAVPTFPLPSAPLPTLPEPVSTSA